MAYSTEIFYERFLDEYPISNIDEINLNQIEILKVLWGGYFVNFGYDLDEKCIYPIDGSFCLLGNEHVVNVKRYTLEEFTILIKTATKIICTFTGSTPEHFFQTVRTKFYYDYSKIITDLEDKKIVITEQSDCIMATDMRKFKIMKGGSTFLEVDCLGCKMWEKITNEIIELWKSNLK